MKRLFLLTVFAFICVLTFAQEIAFTFTAHYHSEYAALDSVLVKNISQNRDTTLFWPDTVLNLDLSSIPNITASPNQLFLSPNFPNPFNGSTETTLFLPTSVQVNLELYDLNSQKLANYNTDLERGYHNFTICLEKVGVFILIVSAGNMTEQVKIINTGKHSGNDASIIYQGNSTDGNTNNLHQKQTDVDGSYFIYNSGDTLKFTGYINGASAYITDAPEQDSTFLISIQPTFDFVIETTDVQTSYSFTVGGPDEFEVIWEPGQSVVYNSSGEISHNFGEAGMWRIKVRGEADYILFNENPEMFRDILTPVEPAVTGIMLSANMFRGITVSSFSCENWFDQASQGISDMSHMFNGSAYNQDISNWSMSSATNLSGMFAGSDFNQPLNDWHVHNVESFAIMFSGSAYNQDLSNWNVSGATDMSDMFSYSEFNQPIENWDVSNVTNMACMFSYSVFNQDISNWDVSNVTNMGYMPYNTNGMFQNSAFDQDISTWDVSSVINFTNFLKNSALSTEHYNNLLIQWSELNLQPGVTFDGGNSMYDLGLPADQRQYIIDEFGWIFNDGGDTGEQY
ncbi:MAG: BspA family leucine-rich repeat surface protein [Bacteroidales bacterium]|jgi:surface protein|nr:BspA family leucine-rich repeat surface protein [Bacteroidales bacterium]